MIHVFRGCQSICSGCNGLCQSACSACDGLCVACCSCSTNVCSEACRPLGEILTRPLGCYVLTTITICVPTSGLALASLLSDTYDVRRSGCDQLHTACIITTVLGALHILFALHAQRRLALGASDDPDATLLGRAHRMVLYDFGFCTYVLVFPFSFIYGCCIIAWSGGCGGVATLPLLAGILLVLYGVCAANLAVCWCMGAHCAACFGGIFGSSSGGSRDGPPARQAAVPVYANGAIVHPQAAAAPWQHPVAAAAALPSGGYPAAVVVSTGPTHLPPAMVPSAPPMAPA